LKTRTKSLTGKQRGLAPKRKLNKEEIPVAAKPAALGYSRQRASTFSEW